MTANETVERCDPVGPVPCVSRVESVFAQCFFNKYKARLSGGYDEPLYRPGAPGGDGHVLRYREDFVASALHEAAHWCIAGRVRRMQTDFGYWYAPDGRTESQQKAFENVEYKPQALEWFFSRACGHPFRLSIDNLAGNIPADDAFGRRVLAQVMRWCEEGLSGDAKVFFCALCWEFATENKLDALQFSLSELK